MTLGIVKYLSTLVPHIEKSDILEDLRVTESELQTIVIPSYNTAAGFFGTQKFKSSDNKKIDEEIRDNFKPSTGRGSTFLADFATAFPKVERNLATLIKAINHEIGTDVVTDGVSSKRVVLIRIAEKFSFLSRYSLDLINLVYVNETVELGGDTSDMGLSPAEIIKVKKNIGNIARLMKAYSIDHDDFQKAINKTPDVILSRLENDGIEGTYSDSQMDPVTPEVLVGFTGNPIYHIRMLVAEWQTKRYKSNQEKKKVLELRLLYLTLNKEKNGSNPKLEKEIAYHQSRIARLDRELLEVQEDLELNS